MRAKKTELTRRGFIGGSAASLAAFTIVPRYCVAQSRQIPPSEKIRMAGIGVGGRGGDDVNGINNSGQVEFLALADVDTKRSADTYKKLPKAKPYQDFRKMLDEVAKDIDAVVVGTPDHTHAVAAIAAMKRGKHVYCEKPMAHSIWEVREMMKAAKENKVISQLGNQGHSFATIRTFCEWIWDGAIGNVKTIHAGCSADNSAMGRLSVLENQEQVPEGLDWDLWLGPAQFRPYHRAYCPGSWRSWMPFGTGTSGDWICHVVDPVFWALDLGAPTSILAKTDDAEYDPKKHGNDTFPRRSIIKYEFPAKGERGPVTLYWYNGRQKMPRPEELEAGRNVPDTGAIVLGDKGGITYGSHGANGVRLFPEPKMRAYQEKLKAEPLKKTLPRVRDHHWNWINSIRSGEPAGSDFSYGGPLTELALLGVIAIRLMGQELKWDGPAAKFIGNDEATALVTPKFREGWTL